jgi:hypothetical protein
MIRKHFKPSSHFFTSGLRVFPKILTCLLDEIVNMIGCSIGVLELLIVEKSSVVTPKTVGFQFD